MEEKITKAIRSFISELSTIKKDEEKVLRGLEQEYQNAREESDLLRKKQEDCKLQLENGMDDIREREEQLKQLERNLNKEIASYEDKKTTIYRSGKEIEEELKNAKLERKLTSEALEKVKQKKADYDKRLKSLQADDDKIDKKNKEYLENKRLLDVRENALNKTEENLNERQRQLDIDELKVKAREKEVEYQIEKYKLQKKIGGK